MNNKLFKQRIIFLLAFIFFSIILIQCTSKKEEPIIETSPQILASKVKGGDWHSDSTWVQGKVPSIDSDVNVSGKVIINKKAECLNLMIDNGASIEIMKDASLTVKHHIINEGTIINNGEIKVRDKSHK